MGESVEPAEESVATTAAATTAATAAAVEAVATMVVATAEGRDRSHKWPSIADQPRGHSYPSSKLTCTIFLCPRKAVARVAEVAAR